MMSKIKSTLANSVYNLELKVEKLQDLVSKLQSDLREEQTKSKLYLQLLKNHTNIKVDEVEEEKIEKVSTEEDYFSDIRNNRIYVKSLKALQQYRKEKLENITISEYTILIHSHIKKLAEIWKEKGYDDKKIENSMSKALTPLEQRLVKFGKYYNAVLDPDEMELYRKVVKKENQGELKVFDIGMFSERFYSYSLALIPLEELMGNYVRNSGIIYLPLEKNEEGDPFSFYTLTKVEPKKWKLELRLDELSKVVSENILKYGINLFRSVYSDIFHDNTYRQDYSNISQWTQQDGEQLLLNLIILVQPKRWCRMLQKAVITNCSYETTTDDKYNLKVDERLHKVRFNKEKDRSENVGEIIKQLFDEIGQDEISNILSKYKL